jgi:hypothetical protein
LLLQGAQTAPLLPQALTSGGAMQSLPEQQPVQLVGPQT